MLFIVCVVDYILLYYATASFTWIKIVRLNKQNDQYPLF